MSDLLDSEPQPASNAPELSVTQLSQALKRTVEDAYGFVRVRGELGRVTIAKSGHLYADLKDDKSVLSTVMWKGQASRLPFRPEEGLEVVAEGRLSTYPGRSNYQLIAESIRPAGVGALMQLLEERKKKLAAEGLFDADRKRPLPYLPRTIGVVTSPTGAVIRDILHRVEDRFPVRVLVWPVLVQGEHAAAQISAGIRGFNAAIDGGPVPRPDVIIVARGGGSIEDLWPFNEEIVVRAAAESRIPLISAVGHETDTTLIDYVSDKRAPTPTGAAEMALPVRSELIAFVEDLSGRARRGLMRGVDRRKADLRAASSRLPRLEALLQSPRQRLDFAGERLGRALFIAVERKRAGLDRAAARIQPQSLVRDATRRRAEIKALGARLKPAILRDLETRRRALSASARVLESVSHTRVLARGFALVRGEDGHIIRAADSVKAGDALSLLFSDGEVAAVAGKSGPSPQVLEEVARKPSPKASRSPGSKTRPKSRSSSDDDAGGGQGSLF
ncbi:MAG: exodeoxyribonuclease VII large subunit [Pseudomonadota bacterium]